MKYATNAEFLHANWTSADILMANLLQKMPRRFLFGQLDFARVMLEIQQAHFST